MTTTQTKQKLHQYIDTAEDKKLKAIYTLLENDIEEIYMLSDEQKEMLKLSDEDIKYNRLTSQEQLDKEDLGWLKDQ